MINPIRQARLDRGMTQKELASHAHMSAHALLRYEQGLYEEISPNLLDTICEVLLTDPFTLRMSYSVFREYRQQTAKHVLFPLPAVQITPDNHPFAAFRSAVINRAVGKDSRIGFCILLAINPAVVLNYDKGKQHSMPSLIKHALLNADVPESYVEMLDTYGQLWHDRYGHND